MRCVEHRIKQTLLSRNQSSHDQRLCEGCMHGISFRDAIQYGFCEKALMGPYHYAAELWEDLFIMVYILILPLYNQAGYDTITGIFLVDQVLSILNPRTS
jgi:hypothetical protein